MNQLKPIKPTAVKQTTAEPSSVAAGALMLGWKMDVTAASDLEQPGLMSPEEEEEQPGFSGCGESAIKLSKCKPIGRGLNRLAPKTDNQSVQRRERLQKLRRTKKVTPATDATRADEHTSPRPDPIAFSPTKAASESRSTKSFSSKPAAIVSASEAVRSMVVAETAPSFASANSSQASGRPQVAVASQFSPAPQPRRKSKTQVVGDGIAKTEAARASGVKSKALVFTVKEPPPVEQERYSDWLRRVILKHRWMSLVTTFYVHWLLILALAALLVHGPEDTVNMLLNASFASEDLPEEATFEVAVPEPAPMETVDESKAELVNEAAARLSESQLELDESVLNNLASASDALATEPAPASTASPEKSSANPAVDRSPPQAVRKGSFSVWTEPSSPQAGEPYRIIIQICLPNGMEKYNVADLEGVVVGSDGYRKPIPGYLRGFLPIEDGYARLIVPIVTADENVQDTIFIRSRILKETQKLMLEFESDL